MSVIEAPAQPVVQPVTRADVLHRAADLLEEWGWEQGSLLSCMDKRGPVCLLKAILWARLDFGLGPDLDRYRVAWATLGQFSSDQAAYQWNDAPGRTKAEVVARLRAAANTSPQ